MMGKLPVVFLVLFVYYEYCRGDCCPKGSLQGLTSGRCYVLIEQQSMFNLSEQNCEQAYGGHLTSVQNAYENSFLENSATSLFGSPQSIWLGANKTSDNWFWIDRSLFKYTNWAQGQPVVGLNCLSMSLPTGVWTAHNCTLKLPYICEVPSVHDPCPTTPPPNPCPSGWDYFGGYCYYPGSNADWNTGNADCQSRGAQLASIHSDAENDFIAKISNAANTFVWFGLYKPNGTWVWTDGTPVDYTNWMPGEPNGDGPEFCGEMGYCCYDSSDCCPSSYAGPGWNDYKCAYAGNYVCKKLALSK